MEEQYDFNEDGGSMKSPNQTTSPVDDSKNVDSGGFECNICLENVQDPVITLCGHLYCWPCIYTWINGPSSSPGDTDYRQPQCPICKAIVDEKSLIPLYGRDQSTNTSHGKSSNLGLVVPQRPQTSQFVRSTPSCNEMTFSPMLGHNRSHMRQPRMPVMSRPLARHLDYQQPHYYFRPRSPQFANVNHPGFGMLGERVYSMMFGDSSYYNTGINNLRFQRQMMEVDISLSRLCLFMFCCMVFCLLLF